MSENVPVWFQEEFQSDAHLEYQRKGAKLRNTVRVKTGVKGSKTHFNTAGSSGVGDKSRGGDVPILGGARGRVPCDLHAKFGGDYVEDIDEVMSSVDEKKVIATSFAWAHGRHTDDIIISHATGAEVTQVVGDYSEGLTQPILQAALKTLNGAHVPDDGQRTALVTAQGWEELLKIDAFADADYVGDKNLPWLNGCEAKRWRNCLWMMHTGLPQTTAQATCTIYHKTAIGHAIGKELTSTWSWENRKSAHFVNTRMLQGGCLIDKQGIVKIHVKNDAPL